MAEPDVVAWTPTAKRALQQRPGRVATAAIEFAYGPLSVIHRIEHHVTIIAIEHRADAYR